MSEHSFIKWAGGKSKLVSKFKSLLPSDWKTRTYMEPFLGGGAMFFQLFSSIINKIVYLNDVNEDLILTYEIVRDNPTSLMDLLAEMQDKHSKEHYYTIRSSYNESDLSDLERAAYFIYLNKTGFNGLYRLNKQGKFNVPVGSYKNPTIYTRGNILGASKALQYATLCCMDFDDFLKVAHPSFFIYFDPPYEPLSQTSNFTSYTKGGFSQEDQIRLRNRFIAATVLGAKCMLSNSNSPFIKELYKDFNIHIIQAKRTINCKGDKRNAIDEIVVTNY